jgi:histidinol-phosphatase
MSRDLAADLALALEISDACEVMAMARYQSQDLVIETKPDLSPVSDADKSIEEYFRKVISEKRPDDQIIGEEFGRATLDGKSYYWVIDPIDGTKNFVRGIPSWGILIALIDPNDEVVLGVASSPALFRRWYAVKNQGAHLSINGGAAKPLQVSKISKFEDASLSYSDLFGWGDRRSNLLALQDKLWRVRGLGDFWSHLLVAEGAVEMAAEPSLQLWDMAAISIIVKEAGGAFTDLQGVPGPHGTSAVSSNHLLHQAFLAALNEGI